MLFVVSKLVDGITSPINWILFLLIMGCLLRHYCNSWWRNTPYLLACFFFLVFTNPKLSVLALDLWSSPYNAPLPEDQVFDIAIVAGGSVAYSPRWNQVDYNGRGDRIVEAIRLYRNGIVKKLFLSGEMAFNDYGGVSYFDEFLAYMAQMGVPAKDIVLERQARTTSENIQYLKRLIARENNSSSILVITSGWHMRRVMKGLAGSDLNLTPYAVDVPSSYPVHQWQEFLPSWQAAMNWKLLFHELLGLMII